MRIKNFVQLFAAAAALTLTLSIGVTALATNNTGTNQSATVYYKITREGSSVDRVYDVSLGGTYYTINGLQTVNESIDANGKIVTNTIETWGTSEVTVRNNGKLAVHAEIDLSGSTISLTTNDPTEKDLAPGEKFSAIITSKAKMDGLTIDGQSHEAGSITLVLSEITS